MTTENTRVGLAVAAALAAANGAAEAFDAPRLRYEFECYDADGRLKWRDEFCNLVTTEGKNDLLDKYFKGSSYTAAWYVGLISSVSYSALAAGDTAAQINGTNAWKEANTGGGANTPTFSQGTRPALTLGSVSGGSVDNSASKAAFSITGTGTIKGAFVASVSTLGGTTGKLYSEGTFSADRSVVNGDTLNVQVTLTAS